MIDQLIEGNVTLDKDTDDFRIDVYDGVDNTSMYLGYQGINAFHSVVPSSIFEFYDYIGMERSVGSRPETDLYAIRPLLSVKYLLNPKCGDSFLNDENEPRMQSFNYLKTENDYYIYENENYIPYGFSYDYYMNYEFCDEYSEENRAAMMLKAILLTDEQIEKYSRILKDIESLETEEYFIDSVSLNLNDETFIADCQRLAATSAKSFKTDKKGFTAVVERNNENLVFFSVPYDEGWSATVNGKPAEIEKVNSGFMAVLVPAGESTIRFTYTTPGLYTGIMITIITAIVMIIYAIIFTFLNKKPQDITDYPEGELLLVKWKMQESFEATRETLQEDNDLPVQNKPSILDNNDSTNTPLPENKFKGGFTIKTDFSDED